MSELKQYRVGATPDAPFHNCTMGGISFVKESKKWTFAEGEAKPTASTTRGSYVEMDDEKVSYVKDKISKNVCRKRGKLNDILSVESSRYRSRDIDVPLANYLFIELIDTPVEAVPPTLSEEKAENPVEVMAEVAEEETVAEKAAEKPSKSKKSKKK